MRNLFYLAAVAMLAWIVTATVLWLGQSGGDPVIAFSYFWGALTSDWMLVLLVTDMLVFTAAAFVWVALDLRACGASWERTVTWLVPMLFLGSVVLFVYLARREPASA